MKIALRTDLVFVLLVSIARLDQVLGSLGLGHGLFQGKEPAIALSSRLGLEGVLVTADLEGEGSCAILDKVIGVGLSFVSG